MKKERRVKLLTQILSLVVLVTSFSGCGSSNPKTPTPSSPKQSLVYNISAESASIDPAINDAVQGGTVISANFEGLTRQDEMGVIKKGVAKDWTISKDGLVYTFTLRDDAKWSDGQLVKAQDFEYAWKRALDPKLAAVYSTFFTDYIVNASEYYAGKVKWEKVGIKIKNDKTIEITLKHSTSYFLQLLASNVFMPVRKDMVEKSPDNWTQSGDTYVGNGPFQMTKWVHNDSIEFKKNVNYWDAKNIKLDTMTFVMVNDSSSALTSWEKGEIDVIESVPASEEAKLMTEKKVTLFPYLSNVFVYMNTSNKTLSDVRVRKALQLSIDRTAIINAVTKSGEKPAYGFVSYGILEADGKTEFRDKGGDLFKADVAQAKKLLADAGYPEGKGFPQVTYLYNTADTNKNIAEALQQQWKANLGIDIKLENIEWSVFLDRRRKQHDFDMARGSWVGDYADPLTFLGMFESKNKFNDAQYKNPEYDKIINQATIEADPVKRMELMHSAEKIIIDDAVIAPIFYPYTKEYIRDGIKGLYVVPTGTVYFDHVSVLSTK